MTNATLTIRKIDTDAVFAAVAALNSTRATLATLHSKVHASATGTTNSSDYTSPTASALQVTAANASSLATLRTLCRNIWSVGKAHFADDVAHAVADTTNLWGDQPAEDASLEDLQTWLNARKASFTAHLTQSGVHYANDATTAIASDDATNQSTANALGNEIKGDLNAHINLALAGSSIKLVPG